MAEKQYKTFEQFWPYYLGEHKSALCRQLHFIGTTIAVGLLGLAIVTLTPTLLLGAVVSGYFWAWIGHFFVEKNRPATFTYPVWSLLADFRMWGLMLRGKLWSGEPTVP